MSIFRTSFRQGPKALAAALSAALLLGCISCGNEITPEEKPDDGTEQQPGEENGGQQEVPGGLVITDGMARLYVALPENSLQTVFGKPLTDWSGYTVTVAGKQYQVATDESGKAHVDVEESEDGTYDAVLTSEASAPYAGTEDGEKTLHPFSYAYHTAADVVSALPQYASYVEEKGAVLEFSSGMAVLKVRITGTHSIASVHVQDNQGGLLGGHGTYDRQEKVFAIEEGTSFVNLNCTNKGAYVPLTDAGADFLIPIPAGSYPQGLSVRVCDSEHRMCTAETGAFEAGCDEVHEFGMSYSPDKDLLFYESFDNFVWGGDVMGGSTTFGLNPKDEEVTETSFKTLSGYEQAIYKVTYDTPGSGYIQKSSKLSDISGKTVEESRNMSSSYIKSRGVGEYLALFRVREHQGYISVGASDSYNGIFEPALAGPVIDMQQDLKISFDICPKADFDDDMLFTASAGANIVACSIDGAELPSESFSRLFSKTGSTGTLYRSAVGIPSDMASPKQWHRVELTVRNVNDASSFSITTASSHAKPGSYGFYFDNFEVRSLYDASVKKSTTLRVLYWNIQNGMWADQDNNYDNFVAWVKKYNPDVCVWCEGETIFNTAGNKVYGTDRVLPGSWASVAGRYGHTYMSKGADKDNYPQIITSKHKINTVEQIYETGVEDSPIAHGAGHFSITYEGREVHIISFHAYAQAYHPKYEGKSDEEKNASAALKEGDMHRAHEMKYICDNVINASAYSSVEDWLMMGDFNAVSRKDEEHYSIDTSDTVWLEHDYLLENTDMVDIIAERNAPEDYFSSINGDARRIDFMYASPSMYGRVQSAAIIIDSWTNLSQDKTVTTGYFCRPSDHRPILVDFKVN